MASRTARSLVVVPVLVAAACTGDDDGPPPAGTARVSPLIRLP